MNTQINELQKIHSETWTDSQTAKKAGVGIGTVVRYNKVMNSNNEDLKEKVKVMNLTFNEQNSVMLNPVLLINKNKHFNTIIDCIHKYRRNFFLKQIEKR